jgi:Rod binding domain-containing protein
MLSAVTGQNPLQPAASSAAAPSPKLIKAAHEFESILLQSWMEKMNKSFLGTEESQDPAHDTVSSLGTQAIATALSARGGIGIADMILRQLQRQAQPAPDRQDKDGEQPPPNVVVNPKGGAGR